MFVLLKLQKKVSKVSIDNLLFMTQATENHLKVQIFHLIGKSIIADTENQKNNLYFVEVNWLS